jgi:hypothetical protein
MLNKEIFELVVAVNDTDFICYHTITEYQKQQQIEAEDFQWVHLVYAVQDDKTLVFYI